MTPEEFLNQWHDGSATITVKTSGSTGTPKTMEVEKSRMLASARMTCNFLGLKEGDTALLCMSPDYIAGKMMIVRAVERKLKMVCIKPSGHPMRDVKQGMIIPDGCFDLIAMVPMQVYNTLRSEDERQMLMQTKHLLIGGGAIDAAMEEELSSFPNAVWSTYGMTETLSHIALRRLNGRNASDWYTPFDNVTLSQTDEGCLVIDAPEMCGRTLVTNDIVEMSNDGRRFRVIGRRDNVICSGGIKIQIEKVEALLKTKLDTPFIITKCSDRKFGEAIVMLYEGDIKESKLRDIAKDTLPRYWQPRYYINADRLPMTETGKPARKEAMLMAESLRVDLGKDTATD